MPVNDNITEIGQAYHALYHNIQARRAYGYGVISGCSASPGTDLAVDVASGTVLYDGSEVSISSTTVTLTSAHADDPRKDVIVYDGSSVTDLKGSPAPVSSRQSGATRFDTFQPSPPDTASQNVVVIAEVWVAAGATSLDSADINDLRTDPGLTANSIANQDYNEAVDSRTSGSSETLDLSVANWFEVTLGADTSFSFSATGSAGNSFIVALEQDGTGGRTPSWPASVTWHDGATPNPPADGGEVVELSFTSPDGGSTWRGRESWRA